MLSKKDFLIAIKTCERIYVYVEIALEDTVTIRISKKSLLDAIKKSPSNQFDAHLTKEENPKRQWLFIT